MRHWKSFYNKWILVSDQRYRLFNWLSIGFALLIPLCGWNPLLILWTINAFLCYKETQHSKIRFFYVILGILFLFLTILNLSMGAYALLQYFGFFTK